MQQAQLATVDVHLHPGSTDRTATVLPGRGYTCDAPLLHYTRLLLRTRGWSVRTVHWTTPPTPAQLQDLATNLLDQVQTPQHLIIAKSLSTWLLPLAVDRSLPGIWFTPLLREAQVRHAAEQAGAATLLVGGSADPHWNSIFARACGRRVLEMTGADHSIEVPGNVSASLQALQTVMTEVEDFIDNLS